MGIYLLSAEKMESMGKIRKYVLEIEFEIIWRGTGHESVIQSGKEKENGIG